MPTPQEVWDYYRTQPHQDMYDYSPFLREIARGNILEIGVRGGVSTSAFLLGLDDKDAGHLYSIDINTDCGLLFSHPRWTFLPGFSQTSEFDIPELDILLVDGDHHYEPALADLKRFEPFVKKGGYILMHDVAPNDPDFIKSQGWYDVDGCAQAWKDFVALHPTWVNCIRPGITGLGVTEKK